ncbi:MAG: metallophosphoesterase [Candidatus Woesearchaeota archaeon]
MGEEEKAKVIEDLFERGILVNKELLEKGVNKEVINKIEMEQDIIVVNGDYVDAIEQQSSLIDWYEIDRYRVEAENDRDEERYQNELQQIKKVHLKIPFKNDGEMQEITNLELALSSEEGARFENVVDTSDVNIGDVGEEGSEIIPGEKDINSVLSLNEGFEKEVITKDGQEIESQKGVFGPVEITISYENKTKKYAPADFANIFLSRFRYLEKILRHRQDLLSTLAIDRVLKKKEKEAVSIIGIVQDLATTKNGNIIAKIEDPTGIISVLFSKNKKDFFKQAGDLVLDEVVGIVGTCQGDIIFADNIVWPDLPGNTEVKKSEAEEYALFLSDFHVGSKLFLKEAFNKFLEWINSRAGNEHQKALAQKVRYIIITGDAVDGVGIFPSQEEELEINDIKEQYIEFARLIRRIPSDKQIILCPGNHDAVQLAEPQPIFYKEFCPDLFEIPNLRLVSNPAMVNIGKTKTFSGFDILMYHGYSFDYYVANVDSIRNNGGYLRADLIMKFLLKRRHLAPSFKSTPYFPGHAEDPLLIKKIPDFFITGHIHYCSVATYKGVTMISGSCWQGKSSFQEKLGHEPQPARVPIVNLKTREIKVLKFSQD